MSERSVPNEFAISVLLHEYDGLRSEVTTRVGGRTNFMTVLTAAITLSFALWEYDHTLTIAVAIGLVLLGLLVWAWLTALIFDLGTKLAQVEHTINTLAHGGQIPSRLLTWETDLVKSRKPLEGRWTWQVVNRLRSRSSSSSA